MLAPMHRALWFFRTIILLLPFNLHAASFSVSQSAPPGFEDFSTAQTTRVDIYFGRKLVGSAMATFDVGRFEFSDSDYVATLVSAVNDPAVIAKSLKGSLDPHSEELCPRGETLGCGVIRPVVAGIIFEESKFRVDLFISPEHLKTVETQEDIFLPSPTKQLSTLSLFRASLLGGKGTARTQQIDVDTSVAYGRTHLNQRISLDSEQGTGISQILISHTGNKWIHSAGTLRASGLTSALISSPKILGVRSAVSLLMHRDRSTFSASPFIISLDERSRVDLILDDRIIRSAFYEAGNQLVDTSSLPNGSYSVEIKVSNSRGERTETRFFTRSPAIPAKHFAAHFFEYGQIIEENGLAHLPEGTSRHLFNMGSRVRLHNNVGAEFQWLQSNFSQRLIQTGFNVLLPHFNQHVGLLASSNRLLGESYNFSFLHPKLSFSAAYRHLRNTALVEDDEAELLSTAAGQYWEVGLSGKLFGGSMVANYRSSKKNDADRDNESYKNYVINYRRAIYRSASMRADITVGVSSRANDETYSVGFNISKTSMRSRSSLSLGHKKNTAKGNQGVVNANSSLNIYEDNKVSLKATAFSSLSTTNQNVGVGLSGVSEWGAASLDISGKFALENTQTTYVLGLESALLNSGRSLSLGGSTKKRAGLIIEIEGDAEGEFDVIVDDRVRATIPVGKKTSVLLSPYKNYSVEIRENGEALYKLDSPERTVTLLPGNVIRINQKVQKVIVLIARAVDANGQPLANARFTNISEFSTTDDSGWFQIELAEEKTLTLETPDKNTWQIAVPENPDNEDVLILNDLQGFPQILKGISASPQDVGTVNTTELLQ